jgi:hypothetical protein
MKFTRRIGLMLFVVSFIAAAGCATLNDIFKGNPGGGETLDEATVVAGLKEALQIGTQNTVLSTSKLDGYLGNQLIRIAVPEQLVSVASTLRQLGLGSQVDELEVGMNRAAERAAGEARDIFWNAITTMTVADAFGILRGGNTAATDYFHDRTAAALRTRFKPIIEQKIGEVGIANIYNQIAVAYNGLPMTGTQRLVDLDEYVTDRALAGLFAVLATEETRIREDPLARTTELLRKVFGN